MSDLNNREDVISREQFREQMYHRCFEVDNDPNMQKWESGNWIRWKLFEEELDKAPTVVPSIPQGEWIDMGDFEKCSICKGTRLKEFQSYYGKTTWIKTPYCPHCGAKMK